MNKIDHDAALEWAANLSGQAFSNDRNIALTYIAMHAEHKLLETKLADAKAEIKRLREILEFLPDDDAALDAKIGELK